MPKLRTQTIIGTEWWQCDCGADGWNSPSTLKCLKCGQLATKPLPEHGESHKPAWNGKESKLQADVEAWLRYKGIYFVHLNEARGNKIGVPDLVCCMAGKFVAIELKTEKGRVSKAQEENMQEIGKAGGLAVVCRSLDEVREVVGKVMEGWV